MNASEWAVMITAEDVRDYSDEYLKEIALMEIQIHTNDLSVLFKQYADYSLSLPSLPWLTGSWFDRVYLPLFLTVYMPTIEDDEISALDEICKAISIGCGISRHRAWKALADCLIDYTKKHSHIEAFLERTNREKIYTMLTGSRDCKHDEWWDVRKTLDCSQLRAISARYCESDYRQELGLEDEWEGGDGDEN